jgi:hydrogenase nickel incorporation protein HypB
MGPNRIPVIERIMGANDTLALENRARFDTHGLHAINVMAGPGAGKTSLIIRTAHALRGRHSVCVVDGDIASNVDTETILAAGIPAAQVNTAGACHLDARMLRYGLDQLDLDAADILFIENVGNLICPVGFALGEHTRVAISSIPEGDDKPHKYPTIYTNVDALVINKIDLLGAVAFDLPEFRRLVRSLNPDIRIFEVSCTTGQGIDVWADWVAELAG